MTSHLDLSAGARVNRARRTDKVSKSLTDEGFGGDLDPTNSGADSAGRLQQRRPQFDGQQSHHGRESGLSHGRPARRRQRGGPEYFGAASYNALTQGQKNQVAAAKAVRGGQLAGLIYSVTAPDYNATLPAWSVGPSYKFTQNATAYLTWGRQEKAGSAQISGTNPDGSGRSLPVNKETVDAYELGLKSNLLNHTLTFNSALYYNRYKNYIQPIVYYDAYLSAAQGPPSTPAPPGMSRK